MRRVIPLAFLALGACYGWSAKPPSSPGGGPREVRVVTRDGKYRITGVTIAADSIAGLTPDSVRAAFALADVTRVEVRHLDVGRTVLAVSGVALVALGVAAIAQSDPEPVPVATPIYSCPLVYSWDGNGWRLDSGTFGGAIVAALRRTDVDNLEFAVADRGTVRLRIVNELRETDYIDALGVIAVDRAAGVIVAPDPRGGLHAFRNLSMPIRAADLRGRDALPRVAARDEWYWASAPSARDTAIAADVRDGIELVFLRPPGATEAHLVVDGNNTMWATLLVGEWVAARGPGVQAWYDSMNADPRRAMRDFAPLAREGFLTASIATGSTWAVAGQYPEAGPEISKQQVLHLDLRGVRGDTVRVRLETVPGFWLIDRAAIAFGADEQFTTRPLELAHAHRAGGLDVRNLVNAADGAELVLETGESAELAFAVPAAPAGTERSYVLRSTGWYRIHEAGAHADSTMLARIAREPLALSRIAVGRLNDALAQGSGARP